MNQYCKHTKKHVLATTTGQLWCSYCGAIKWRFAKQWEYSKFWKDKHKVKKPELPMDEVSTIAFPWDQNYGYFGKCEVVIKEFKNYYSIKYIKGGVTLKMFSCLKT